MRAPRTALVAAAVTAVVLAGCSSSHPTRSTSTAPGGPLAVAPVTATHGNQAVVYALAASRWTAVPLPHPPADSDAVASRGSRVYTANVDASGVALDYSNDGGHSWHSRRVAATRDLADVALALSPDGSRLGVVLDRPGSAGAVGGASVLVGATSGGAFTSQDAPSAGQLAWWRNNLVLSGGALSSRLYLGDSTGASWHPVAVGGPVAPRFNVDPSVPSIGVAQPLPNGNLLVPVTNHAGSPHVDLLATGNGSAFRSLGQVALSGSLGSGTVAAVSALPDGTVMVSDPNTLRFHVVSGGTDHAFAPTGLPAPPSSISFVTATQGLAQVDLAGCSQGKTDCSTEHEVFATTDAGRSWTPAQ